jgi:hypothetical protein
MQLNTIVNKDCDNIFLLYKQAKQQSAFEEFADKRGAGAAKIAKNAKAKGGPAMLTYHHFNVKLSHYNKAAQGKFDVDKAKTHLKELTQELNKSVGATVKMSQIEFQKKVGLIEVLGELIIQHNK